MAVTYVNGMSVGMTNSTLNAPPMTVPTVQDNDLAVVVVSQGSSTITTPAGLTQISALAVGSNTHLLYTKFLSASESGDTWQFTSAAGQRMGIVVGIYRGVGSVGVLQSRAETVSTDTHLAPTAVSPTGGSVAITCITERSSVYSTAFTQPSGYVLRQSAFSVGTGAGSAGIADRLTLASAGASIGGGTWVATAANLAVGTWTLGLVASTVTTISGTFVIAPASGTAPLSVTGTVNATGGTGTPYTYTYNWGDGTTTGPTSSATSPHTYSSPAAYTSALNNRAYVDVNNT